MSVRAQGLCEYPHTFLFVSLCLKAWGYKVLCEYPHTFCFSSCSKCRRRKGRSAFRKASRQDGRLIDKLYEVYAFNTGDAHRLAGEKLKRWGFNPDRRCLIPVVCKHLLIRPPGSQNSLFPSVDWRDKLHGLLTFLFRSLCEEFPRMGLSTAMKQILDQRLTQLGLDRIMRDPNVYNRHVFISQCTTVDSRKYT